ncbi:unnamed protein product [Brassicogethes aeneus]|uniref:Uncharacterized protein n=1 Tax=Brassicogethes aeneus TaxID=1431903 RepID=A0A9P0B145_BRAAE|nr:unnamed protein product [Brassicogethes aeneus]
MRAICTSLENKLQALGVLQQISKRNLQILTLKNPDGNMSQTAAQFCKSLFAPYQLKHFYRDEETDAVLIGQKRVEDENVAVFDRCIYDNVIYRSTMYTRSAKTDDTVVMLRDNTVLQILRFESHNGHCYIVRNKCITVPVRVQSNNVKAQLSFYSRVVKILKDYETKVGIENNHRKLVNVQVINKHYVVMMPNCFEIQ